MQSESVAVLLRSVYGKCGLRGTYGFIRVKAETVSSRNTTRRDSLRIVGAGATALALP